MPEQQKISLFTGALLVFAALIVDGSQFILTIGTSWIPVLGWMFSYLVGTTLSVFAITGFSLFFKMHGVSFLPRWPSWLAAAAEGLPLLNNGPFLTVKVIFAIRRANKAIQARSAPLNFKKQQSGKVQENVRTSVPRIARNVDAIGGPQDGRMIA